MFILFMAYKLHSHIIATVAVVEVHTKAEFMRFHAAKVEIYNWKWIKLSENKKLFWVFKIATIKNTVPWKAVKIFPLSH